MSGGYYDFRLIEVEVEIGILEDQLRFIEEQFERNREIAEERLAPDFPSDDEMEWEERRQLYEYEIEVILPRTLRNPFLVSMFSVYEAAVTEIAALIQKKPRSSRGFNSRKGYFLCRAKKYYRDTLCFPLSTNGDRWDKLKILSDLRNEIAHRNGRLELIDKQRRRKILSYKGTSDQYHYLIVSGEFLRETLMTVKNELEDLVTRYRERDSSTRDPR